jgi:hypothetical protein
MGLAQFTATDQPERVCDFLAICYVSTERRPPS